MLKLDLPFEKIIKEVATFKSLNKRANIIIVSDASFESLAKKGDYIGLERILIKDFENHMGDMVLLVEENKDNYLGTLIKKDNIYSIKSLKNSECFLELQDLNELNGKVFSIIWFRKLV